MDSHDNRPAPAFYPDVNIAMDLIAEILAELFGIEFFVVIHCALPESPLRLGFSLQLMNDLCRSARPRRPRFVQSPCRTVAPTALFQE